MLAQETAEQTEAEILRIWKVAGSALERAERDAMATPGTYVARRLLSDGVEGTTWGRELLEVHAAGMKFAYRHVTCARDGVGRFVNRRDAQLAMARAIYGRYEMPAWAVEAALS